MARQKKKRRANLPLIGDMLFSILTLPFAFGYLDEWSTNPKSELLSMMACLVFLVVGISRLFRAFRFRKQSRMRFVSNLIYGIVLVCCSLAAVVLSFIWPQTLIALGLIYWATVLSDRVLSLIRKHKVRNILLGALAILLIITYMVSLFADNTLFVPIAFSAFSALLAIMTVTFSQIRVDILKDVIQKTYATEIIGGLLLLIFAFSYVLRFTEESIPSFPDGLWYCFAVVTTIGFGDFTPVGLIGRVLSVILGMYGIIVVALITSIIVNFYGEMKRVDAEEKAIEEKAVEEGTAESEETGGDDGQEVAQ